MRREGRHAANRLEDLDRGGFQKMRFAIARAPVARGHRIDLLARRQEDAILWRAQALNSGTAGAEPMLRTLWPPPPRDAFAYFLAFVPHLRREQLTAPLAMPP